MRMHIYWYMYTQQPTSIYMIHTYTPHKHAHMFIYICIQMHSYSHNIHMCRHSYTCIHMYAYTYQSCPRLLTQPQPLQLFLIHQSNLAPPQCGYWVSAPAPHLVTAGLSSAVISQKGLQCTAAQVAFQLALTAPHPHP